MKASISTLVFGLMFTLTGSVLSATPSAAALFDTIDSVDTLKRVAATRQESDRMPASDQETKSEATAKHPAPRDSNEGDRD
jgi:hypothetical protein